MQLHLVLRTGEVGYNKVMEIGLKLEKGYQLLDRTAKGEATRTRRKRILRFLYNERYLTRIGISSRLEMFDGVYPSWRDSTLIAFFLDMRFVKKAFQAAGYQLAYSWKGERRGFYLREEGVLSPEVIRAIQGAVAEVDPRQVEITQRLTPGQRVQQGLSLTNLAHNVVRYRRRS